MLDLDVPPNGCAQRTTFLLDPAGNALEFKVFADDGQVFAV